MPLFAHLTNQIFTTGVYPDEYKKAVVILIHKAGDRKEISNYRPISILSVFNKIIEKIIHARLMTFLDKHNILLHRQFGFRKKSGTDAAAIEVVSSIQKELNLGRKATAVFMDLEKAFDTVQHDILLEILHRYGIRGKANDLIKNYLTNRLQYVRIQGSISTGARISQGVVQGSIIGHLLFVM